MATPALRIGYGGASNHAQLQWREETAEAIRMPKGFFVQDLRRRLPAAENAMPWRKMAGRAATTLVLLAGWLALCHALRSFLGEELQLWRWNFRDDPNNPDQGALTGRYIHPANRRDRNF